MNSSDIKINQAGLVELITAVLVLGSDRPMHQKITPRRLRKHLNSIIPTKDTQRIGAFEHHLSTLHESL